MGFLARIGCNRLHYPIVYIYLHTSTPSTVTMDRLAQIVTNTFVNIFVQHTLTHFYTHLHTFALPTMAMASLARNGFNNFLIPLFKRSDTL